MSAIRRIAQFVVLVAICLGFGLAQVATSPVGLWKTFDDKTNKEKSLLRIYEQGGVYFGKVEKTLQSDAEKTCSKCKDDRKDQPMVGLVVMKNMKADGTEFNGGEILDPDNGKIYRCKFYIEDGGKKLHVRGFIGFSLLGRTQYWERVE